MTYLRDMMINFQIEKRSFPIYIIPAVYLAFAMLFPDRWNYAAGLGLALILFLGSYGLGKRLSYLVFKISDQTMYFPLGLGLALGVVYLAGVFSTQPLLFYLTWGSLALLALPEVPILTYRLRRAYLWGVPFVLLGFWSSLTPSTFFDAMVYHLGLPYQYEAIGKIAILPDHLYSTFPPFEQVLNLLFIHFGCESGVKVFSILLLFQIVYLFCGFIRWMTSDPQPTGGNGKDQSHWTLQMGGRIDLLVLAMLLFPAAWILIHIISADLLVTLFFCAGVISLVKTFDSVSRMTIVQSSLLLAFSAWTKSNVLIYFSFLPLLWLALARWRPSYGFWEIVWKHCGMILLFTLPLLLRNYFLLGDPLYPALSGIFSSKSWTPQQSAALQLDSLAGKNSGALEVLLAPLSITFRLDNYGSASEVGLVPLLSLLLYPFARKNRELNCVLFYVLFCYLAWLFTFHNFRQFLPPFYLFFLTAYFSFQYLFQRVRKFVPLIFGLCALYSVYQLLPIYSSFFPLISFGQRQTEYLEQHLSYFRLADVINKDPKNGKVAMLGETRIAYLTKPVVANTAYNQNPFLRMLKSSSSPDDLSSQLRHEEVKFVIVDRNEYLRLAKKYKIWEITPQEENILQDFLKNDTSFLLKSGDDYLFRIR